MATAMPGRNQPCPCGSGRRYKECHGAIGAQDTTTAPARDDLSWIPAVMQAALRAQRSGRLREAAEGYRRVVAAQPENFDANHMLSLVEYEQGNSGAAMALLRHAIELRPDIALSRQNLHVLEAIPLIEDEICREVLPRLMARVRPLETLERFAPPGATVQVVVAEQPNDALRGALEQVLTGLATVRLELWVERGIEGGPAGARRIDLAAGVQPSGGALVLLGTEVSPLPWLAPAPPVRALLMLTRDDPCGAIDRIDQLAGVMQEQPWFACATPALGERLRLPRAAALRASETLAAAPG
jgi:hypothetical protein